MGQKETVNQISYKNYNNIGRDLCYPTKYRNFSSNAVNIEMHTAHDYTYVQSKNADIRTTGRPVI